LARWVRFGVIALLLVCARGSVRAQLVGALDVAGGVGRDAGPWMRESRLSPLLRYAAPSGFLQADGLVVEHLGALRLDRASLAAAALSPSFAAGLLRLSLFAHATSDSATRERWTDATGDVTLSAKAGASGAFLGGAFDRRSPSVVLGAWRSLPSAIVSISSRTAFGSSSIARVVPVQEQRWDSIWTDTSGWQRYHTIRTVDDTTSVSRLVQSRVLEARVDWGMGRWTVNASVFRNTATDSIAARTFGRATATMRLTSDVSLFASGGTTGGPFMRAAPARFGTIGLRISPAALLAPPLPPAIRPAAAAFTVLPAAEGRYRIVVRVPSARSVEISGDFTGWAPVVMHETSATVWEATVALAPGTWRVNVRVDGDAWTAPPGLATVNDEFNGRVGIFVVR